VRLRLERRADGDLLELAPRDCTDSAIFWSFFTAVAADSDRESTDQIHLHDARSPPAPRTPVGMRRSAGGRRTARG
jgi:hypothetical protein